MLKKVFASISDEFADIRLIASSLAFSTLLSIIPFLIIVLAVFQSVGGLEQFYPKIESLLLSYMKEATGNTAAKYIKNSIQNVNAKTLGISGGLFLLWASLGLIKNIDLAFNRIWKVKIRKPMYKRMWLHWLLLLAAPLSLAIFTGIKSIAFFDQAALQVLHGRLIFVGGASMILWALYKFIPDVPVRARPALIAAVLAAVALSVVQSSFLWFSLKVFHNNKIYGSLASFPIFLVWLLVVWYVVLMGVSFCAFLQQKYFKNS